MKKNLNHLKTREEEVKKKEDDFAAREAELRKREIDLEEKERQIEDLERAVLEMQRLQKNSSGGSSTTPGTDLGNDSCIKNASSVPNPVFNKSIDRVFFTSPSGSGGFPHHHHTHNTS